MQATAIVLRGSYINPIYVGIELWKLDSYAHAGILLSDGTIVEASARANQVVHHRHPVDWYNYETLLGLTHLGESSCERIATLALSMKGWKYDWRAAKSQTLEEIYSLNEEDSRRVICFEHVVLCCKEFFTFSSRPYLCDSTDLISAWESSLL